MGEWDDEKKKSSRDVVEHKSFLRVQRRRHLKTSRGPCVEDMVRHRFLRLRDPKVLKSWPLPVTSLSLSLSLSLYLPQEKVKVASHEVKQANERFLCARGEFSFADRDRSPVEQRLAFQFFAWACCRIIRVAIVLLFVHRYRANGPLLSCLLPTCLVFREHNFSNNTLSLSLTSHNTSTMASPSQRSFKAVFFDIGGVVVGSPFQGIADYEKEHNLPVNYINVAM